MVLFIDNYIVLDVLQNRQPHYEYSHHIWELCHKGQIEGYISVLTFANIIYVMRKDLRHNKIYELLEILARVFRFADLSIENLMTAAKMNWKDFEDAIQSATAEKINAAYIITRNTKDFQDSSVKALTPEEFFMNVFDLSI